MQVRLAILGAVVATLAAPALAQAADDIPELAGGPGAREQELTRAIQEAEDKQRAQQKQTQQTAAERKRLAQQAEQQKAEEKRLARLAEQQKAEQKRLAEQAAQIRAEQVRIEKRAAELKAEEARLTQLRADRETAQKAEDARLAATEARINEEIANRQLAEAARTRAEAERAEIERERSDQQAAEERQLADLAREREDAERELADLRPQNEPVLASRDDHITRRGVDRPDPYWSQTDIAIARRACAAVAAEEAWDRNFYSARYVGEQRLVEGRSWILRGEMQIEDRRGYRYVDTACEVERDGEVINFQFLR